MQPRLTPEILQALARRRMGGVGGGNTMPAMNQTMQPNPMGGPMGPSMTPLQGPPQPMPSGSIPSPQQQPSSQQLQSPQQPRPAQQSANVDDETKNMTKALVQRLLKFL